jgi:hypothetical protein
VIFVKWLTLRQLLFWIRVPQLDKQKRIYQFKILENINLQKSLSTYVQIKEKSAVLLEAEMCLDCVYCFRGCAAEFTRAQTTTHRHVSDFAVHVSVIYLPER